MPFRPSIRVRISVLLLLSTLNTVVVATAAMVLFGALADSPTAARVDAARQGRLRIDRIEDSVLRAAEGAESLDLAALRESLGRARSAMSNSPAWDEATAGEWELWERSISQWVDVRLAGGDETKALAAERLAHDRLAGRLLLAGEYSRPEWVDAAYPFLPWLAGWVAVVGVATITMAWSLEVLLSRPLGRLADAADRVANDLSQEIRVAKSVPEVERVARAIAGMRDRLVRTIADVEARNAEMETILSNLSDGVLLVDRDGHILELNRSAQRLLSPATQTRIVEGRVETLGENPPTEGAAVHRWLPELRDLPFDREVEFEMGRDFVGERRHYEIAVRRVPMGQVVVVRDVTKDKEVEKLKRDFLSVVTHELKTPLTAIEGYARLLQLGKGGPLNEKQAQYVNILHTQAGVLKAMVQNLLDANRIEGGNLPVHPQALDLCAFVQQLGDTWRGSLETRGLHFALENGLAPGTEITADPMRLEQIVGNLMSNAGKFTPSGGTITLRSRPLGAEVEVEVQDTGRGIPAQALPRIFEKFYQVEAGDTRTAGGAGLGLYIVRQLVDAMSGRIRVSSEPGIGSTFTITFPLRSSTRAGTPEA